MLNKLKTRTMLLITSLMGMITTVHADLGINVDPGSLLTDAQNNEENGVDLGTLGKVLKALYQVLRYVSAAGVIISVLMLIWCGIQMALSAGNPQKRAMAMEGIKSTLMAAIIIGAASTIASVAFYLIG